MIRIANVKLLNLGRFTIHSVDKYINGVDQSHESSRLYKSSHPSPKRGQATDPSNWEKRYSSKSAATVLLHAKQHFHLLPGVFLSHNSFNNIQQHKMASPTILGMASI
jgi:hypothetical protein